MLPVKWQSRQANRYDTVINPTEVIQRALKGPEPPALSSGEQDVLNKRWSPKDKVKFKLKSYNKSRNSACTELVAMNSMQILVH